MRRPPSLHLVEAVRKSHGDAAAALLTGGRPPARPAQAAPAKGAPRARKGGAKGKRRPAKLAPPPGVPALRASTDPRFAWPLGDWAPTYERAGLHKQARALGLGLATLDFVVEERPVAKERPRVVRGGSLTYTPQRTLDYEAAVRASAVAAMAFSGWPPGGWRDPRARYFVEADVTLAADNADLDNVFKAIGDGLNGWAFPDDRRIAGFNPIRRVDARHFGARVKVIVVAPREVLADRVSRQAEPKAKRVARPKASRKKAA